MDAINDTPTPDPPLDFNCPCPYPAANPFVSSFMSQWNNELAYEMENLLMEILNRQLNNCSKNNKSKTQ